ncbi:MAG: hypothetical protein JOZ72_05560 [Alphaproteobacteria bacterium]|nr:hypothetical protein [Alphaproteobacteria bacterium]
MPDRLSLIALAALLAVCSSAARAETAVFRPGPVGITVNQSTGSITFCAPNTSGTAGAPVASGVCAKIGTAAPSSPIPSLAISDSVTTSVGLTILVTNIYTGKITQCVYSYYTNQKKIVGSCAPIGTAAP